MPTRLLDIGIKDGVEPRLITASSVTTEYATLSHCWGKARPLMTTSSNLSQHMRSVPLLSLPKTFQDAVAVTRELGIRYLWIDSLCIIQDSVEDWELECSRMAQIYQGSIVSICGPTALDSSTGFLNPRTCPEPDPYLWEYRNADGAESKKATISLLPDPLLRCQDYPTIRT